MPLTYEIVFRLPVSLHVKTEKFSEEFAEEWRNEIVYGQKKAHKQMFMSYHI